MVEEPGAYSRSPFVTGIAWFFIVISGFALCFGLLQHLVIAKTLGPAVREAAAQVPEMDSETAAMAGAVSRTVLKALYAGLVLLLVASIGLLKRKGWGRLLFIVLLGLWLAFNLISLLGLPFTEDPIFVKAYSFFFNVLVSGILVWIVVRLLSREISAEFQK